jgi:hypothetical protein
LPGIEEVSLGPSLASETGNEVEVKDTNVNASENIPRQPSQYPYDPVLPRNIPVPVETHSTTVRKEVQPMAVATLINPVENIPPLSPHHSYIQQRIEQEEYWDEEDDENYDEEGYVTARSFRSRGDNTTSGATTVLFPQMNQRARKEIAAAKQLVEATRSPEEVEDESYDTSMVAEYGEEIFDYMKQLEVKMLPNAHYMDNQHEIQWSMRSVLMDWLVQVHLRFNLLPETLFLTVNYIDRFLSCKVVSLGKLQLVGATAIFIAAKYEEINCPSVQEIVYMVDGGYSVDEVLKAERFMLTMLQFELGWPGPMSFLRRISKADDYDLETRTLAKYFLEVTLMDERFIGSPPSFTAAASHCLARVMLRKGTWVCRAHQPRNLLANRSRHLITFSIPDTRIHSSNPLSLYSWNVARTRASTITQFSTSIAISATRGLRHLSRRRSREGSICQIQSRRYPYFNRPWFHSTTASLIFGCEETVTHVASPKKHFIIQQTKARVSDLMLEICRLGATSSEVPPRQRQDPAAMAGTPVFFLHLRVAASRRETLTRTYEVMTN